MFKITYSDNTVEELPAEFIKINGFNVEHFQKSIKQIFVPKEVKNFSGCFANGNIKIELEEGLKKIFITAYRGTTIKIPLSCQKLTFFNVCLETLFVPKNVMVFDFTPEHNDVHKFPSMFRFLVRDVESYRTYNNFPTMTENDYKFCKKILELGYSHDYRYRHWVVNHIYGNSYAVFTSIVKKIWLDGENTKINNDNTNYYGTYYRYDTDCERRQPDNITYYYLKIKYDWIRFNPEDKINNSNKEMRCLYNQPLNRNKLLFENTDPTVCLGQEIENKLDPTKTTYLTKEQYLEIYGEGKCQFMPDYSDVVDSKDSSKSDSSKSDSSKSDSSKNKQTKQQQKQQLQQIIKLYIELQKQGIKLTKPKIKDYTQEQLKQTFKHYQQLKTIFEETEKLITEQNEQADILTSFEGY